MTWNLTTISAFFEAERHNPYEYNRLMTADPVGRMLAAYLKAVADYNGAAHEHAGLGVGTGAGAISSDATRSAALEVIMSAAITRRDTMLAGILSACGSLGDAEEPTVRYFQRRPGEAAMIAALEGIAVACGV
jgi:hypothetical protein